MTVWIWGPVRVEETFGPTFTVFCEECGQLAAYDSEKVAVAHCIRHIRDDESHQ